MPEMIDFVARPASILIVAALALLGGTVRDHSSYFPCMACIDHL